MRHFYKNLGLGLLILNISAYSYAGKERDGGNSQGLSVKSITNYIKTDLRRDALNIAKNLKLDDIKNRYVRSTLEKMIKFNFLSDIESSRYIFASDENSGKCLDRHNNARGATSSRGDIEGDICFDPKILSKDGATKSSILGLLFHEHAHHYGEEDSSNIIGKVLTEYIDFSGIGKLPDLNEPNLTSPNVIAASDWSPSLEQLFDDFESEYLHFEQGTDITCIEFLTNKKFNSCSIGQNFSSVNEYKIILNIPTIEQAEKMVKRLNRGNLENAKMYYCNEYKNNLLYNKPCIIISTLKTFDYVKEKSVTQLKYIKSGLFGILMGTGAKDHDYASVHLHYMAVVDELKRRNSI